MCLVAKLAKFDTLCVYDYYESTNKLQNTV